MRVTKQKRLAPVIVTNAAYQVTLMLYESLKTPSWGGPANQLGFSLKVAANESKDQNRLAHSCLRSRIRVRDLDDRLLSIQAFGLDSIILWAITLEFA
jgi:hypothetical protein